MQIALINILTFHRDFAKFFLSCSDTVPWIFLLLAALPDILKEEGKVYTISISKWKYIQENTNNFENVYTYTYKRMKMTLGKTDKWEIRNKTSTAKQNRKLL